ncbi:MAG: TraR/DksA C4-type zinc finger protein [Candidatus Cloacimonetes bacterium]|jgi:RNA polymerase-binding transcription factor DksA|nr:TraR/DksA C4-type zinc finger protein [Candidatus Cloacimonadota bacterium]
MKDKQTEKAKPDAVFCEQCGRKIPKERLKIIPDAVLCVHCASDAEKDGSTDHIVPLIDYDPSELLNTISSDD